MTKEDATNYTQMGISGILVIALVVGFFMGLISAEAFIGIAGATVAYYFNDRKNSKEINAAIEMAKTSNAREIDLDGK